MFKPIPNFISMIYLNSSAIARVDYDEVEGILIIYFRGSGRYAFHGVPWEVYSGLVSSSSPGRYYNRYIRGRYR